MQTVVPKRVIREAVGNLIAGTLLLALVLLGAVAVNVG